MSTNIEIFNHLIEIGGIQIKPGEIFKKPVSPKSTHFDFNKVEGMLLGLAIGDSLGITTEGMLPSQRMNKYRELRNYIPNRYVNEPRGFPSDDTQLAFWTLEQMLHDGGFDPEQVAKRFCNGRIFGIGSTVRRFILNYKSGIDWRLCAPESAGNGALMRIAPMCVPYLKSSGTDIWVDTALSAMLTHNDTSSISACVAFVAMLWELLDMTLSPPEEWWLKRYVDIAQDLEIGRNYRPRGGDFQDYRGPAWKYVQEKVSWAYENNLSVVEACNSWYSGAYLLETIPSVIYILMRYGNDLETGIIRAVNDTKDNDTIGAIVGAAVGALHGRTAIPERWIINLSGRTTERDDGKIFELIQKAQKTFWK